MASSLGVGVYMDLSFQLTLFKLRKLLAYFRGGFWSLFICLILYLHSSLLFGKFVPYSSPQLIQGVMKNGLGIENVTVVSVLF